MIDSYTIKATEKAEKNFANIQESIKGLYEILSINLEDIDDNFYFQAGEDNLMGLYRNLVELLSNEYGLRQFIKKLKKSEIDLNITLNERLVDEELIEE
ncbi:MAG: hypothetical protein ACFFBP_14475 [Promethearchaeota archaeon]